MNDSPQGRDSSVYALRDRGTSIRLYRIVLTDHPAAEDFRSAFALGRCVRNPVLARLADGLSFYAVQAQAREAAQRAADRGISLGSFVAVVDIPTDGRYRTERTTRSQGHFTVWSDLDVLIAFVAETLTIET